MQYKLEKISTTQACDALLTSAQKKKQTLDRKRRNLGASIDTFRERMDRMASESVVVNLSLEAFAALYEALPEGKDKANIKVKIKRLELRQARVEKKAYTYNVTALLVKEMKYNALESQLLALENYINAVEQRKAALRSATVRVSREAFTSHLPVARPIPQSEEKSYAYSESLSQFPRSTSPVLPMGEAVNISSLPTSSSGLSRWPKGTWSWPPA